ncbi:phage integrase central domain-containing protein [Primorskyibacter sp. 2E107]
MARRVHERKIKDRMNNGKHIAQWIQTLETYAFPTIGHCCRSVG